MKCFGTLTEIEKKKNKVVHEFPLQNMCSYKCHKINFTGLWTKEFLKHTHIT